MNVLALPGGPTVAELASAGVRRVSTGSLLAGSAYGALMAGARELLTSGTSHYEAGGVSRDALRAAFTSGGEGRVAGPSRSGNGSCGRYASLKLQHVSIGIAGDGADAARGFYGELLRLDERPVPPGVDPTRFIWYRVGEGLDLHLHVLTFDDPAPERAHFCLVVDEDLDELRSRIESAGIETRDPTVWTGRPCFYCRDPFRNLIEFARFAD